VHEAVNATLARMGLNRCIASSRDQQGSTFSAVFSQPDSFSENRNKSYTLSQDAEGDMVNEREDGGDID